MKHKLLLATMVFVASAATAQNITSVEIEGEKMMTSGKNHDTAFSNKYALIVKDGKGNVIDADAIKKDFSVVWDIDGFKTENDTKGQYCDSYGAFPFPFL